MNTPDVIKSRFLRNNYIKSKIVDGRSKNLQLWKKPTKWIISSFLIPTNLAFAFFLKCQIFCPTTHFFGCCTVVSEKPIRYHVWGICKLFFPYNSNKFGVLLWLFCRFLRFGIVVGFFGIYEIEKDDATWFILLIINLRKSKILWKFGFFHHWSSLGLQKFFWPSDVLNIQNHYIGIILKQFAENLTKQICVL